MDVFAPAIFDHAPLAVGADCHWIVPWDPVSVRVVLCPAQIEVGDMLAVPATALGITVTVTLAEEV